MSMPTTEISEDMKKTLARKYMRHPQSYRLNRMLPGKGHHGRKTGNKRRSMSGVDDFEINMMISM